MSGRRNVPHDFRLQSTNDFDEVQWKVFLVYHRIVLDERKSNWEWSSWRWDEVSADSTARSLSEMKFVEIDGKDELESLNSFQRALMFSSTVETEFHSRHCHCSLIFKEILFSLLLFIINGILRFLVASYFFERLIDENSMPKHAIRSPEAERVSLLARRRKKNLHPFMR